MPHVEGGRLRTLIIDCKSPITQFHILQFPLHCDQGCAGRLAYPNGGWGGWVEGYWKSQGGG